MSGSNSLPNVNSPPKPSSPNYTVMSPNESFKGKSYVEWIQDWSHWFYQPYPERNNDGDVVFLRSMPLAEGNYQNEPLVMVGNESLEISKDQRILVPIITATYVADDLEPVEWIYGMVRSSISNGDDPPDLSQVRIDGKEIHIEIDKKRQKTLELFEFESPVYHINIPDSPPGQSLKDQVEMPLQSAGYFPAVTRGYFVILELTAGENYYIECRSTGASTPRGPYHVGFLYHIIVNESRPRKKASLIPTRLRKNMAIKLRDKFEKGRLSEKEYMKIIKEILDMEGDNIADISDRIDNLKSMINKLPDRIAERDKSKKQGR
jgi:hypothetical protein